MLQAPGSLSLAPRHGSAPLRKQGLPQSKPDACNEERRNRINQLSPLPQCERLYQEWAHSERLVCQKGISLYLMNVAELKQNMARKQACIIMISALINHKTDTFYQNHARDTSPLSSPCRCHVNLFAHALIFPCLGLPSGKLSQVL